MSDRYRPVHTKLWADSKFLSLSDDGRMVWLMLLTAPSVSPIPGVIIGGEAFLAELIGWPVERLRLGFREPLAKGFAMASDTRLVWLKNALRHQPPTNLNVAKYWASGWGEIPECELKHELWKAIKSACLQWWETLALWFPEPLAKGYPIPYPKQEQEHEQEQEHKQEKEKQRRKPAAPTAQSGFKPALDAFHAYFLAANNGEAPQWGARQRGQLTKLLEAQGSEVVLRRIENLRTCPPAWPSQPWDLATFCTHFDKFTGVRAANAAASTNATMLPAQLERIAKTEEREALERQGELLDGF